MSSTQSCTTLLVLPAAYISSCQDSPVDILNKVLNAFGNVLKFAWISKAPPSFTLANSVTPKTEYRNRNRNRRPPTLVSWGRASMNVLKRTRKLLYLLIILKILLILKDLSTWAKAPIFRPKYVAIIPSHAAATIVQSKLFQGSAKYSLPIPIYLMINSTVYMILNAMFTF